MTAPPMQTFSDTLERHQIAVYMVGLALGGAIGLLAPGADSALEHLVYPVLGALLYVTFLQVPFVQLRAAFASPRFLAATMTTNFAIVPLVVWALTAPLPDRQAVLIGVLLVLLTPCIDYVIAFAGLAGARSQRLLAAAPLLMLAQILLLPLYLWLFLGADLADVVEVGPFVEAFALLIVLPLSLAWATEAWARRRPAGARAQTVMLWLPVPLMALTLLVVVASQLPQVRDDFARIVEVVPVYAAFLLVMAPIGRLAARVFVLDGPDSRALVFSGATRNSLVVLPLALALPDEFALAAVVVVTQTLVELIGMVIYVQLVPRLVPQPAAARA